MTLFLQDIATAPAGSMTLVPLAELAECRRIPSSKLRLLQRYFRLESAAQHADHQCDMLRQPVQQLARRHPGLRDGPGLLLYVRTQTHASHAADDWLNDLAAEAGLHQWEVMAQSQTHCAGGLAAVDLLHRIGWRHPAIILTGEKCFHPVTANQSGAVLGEAPAAALLAPQRVPGRPGWAVSHRHTMHLPRFHANPDRMAPELRKSWEKGFGGFLEDFLQDSLGRFGLAPEEIDLVVPYNLNLPLLESLAQRMGWQNITYTRSLATVGHLFCADVFYNLAQVLPETQARRVLCFAAGMGATFSALVLEKSEIAKPHVPIRQIGRMRARTEPV
ncbi:3-oxoacyl-[acyl-carrier-protein] synthase III C-terminal domain-containing protein [Leisingera thetidis]|uniref:3-oxoacyl-[acyl-carrier-protein] synthase III C-terminal domain-containing protein n=1 Tax=Leisingera thetidis TaxID=2930199 RepID=UPI0021F7365F|nr:3-oxoacyl-[acyl-carrier-protein] synthase III C-terminal domain-containing protein [Leisingera thetidis]